MQNATNNVINNKTNNNNNATIPGNQPGRDTDSRSYTKKGA